MKQIVVKYGLITGGILAVLMTGNVYLYLNGFLEPGFGEVIGYSSMVLAYLFVFFGIRSYRDDTGGGTITFGRAFKVGILITVITCVIYVITWEILFFGGFASDFMEVYTTQTVGEMRADGATEEAIAQTMTDMARFAELYRNPFFNAGITFLEAFPVGLVMTLISAAILRRNEPKAEVSARQAEA